MIVPDTSTTDYTIGQKVTDRQGHIYQVCKSSKTIPCSQCYFRKYTCNAEFFAQRGISWPNCFVRTNKIYFKLISNE